MRRERRLKSMILILYINLTDIFSVLKIIFKAEDFAPVLKYELFRYYFDALNLCEREEKFFGLH